MGVHSWACDKPHQALESGWLCECSTPHLAHLHLERRNELGEIEARFRVLFSSASIPREWRDTEIKIMTNLEKHAGESMSNTNTPQTRSVSFRTDCAPRRSLSLHQKQAQAHRLCLTASLGTQGSRISAVSSSNATIQVTLAFLMITTTNITSKWSHRPY